MGIFNWFKKTSDEKLSKSTTNTIDVKKIKEDNFETNEIDPIYKQEITNGLYPGEIILLWWLKGKPRIEKISNPPLYFKLSYGINVNNSLSKLHALNLLRFSTAEESLPLLTVKELKEILRINNLTMSGKKAELIVKILDNVSSDLLEQQVPYHHMLLTDKGLDISNNYAYIVEAHRDSYFSVVDTIKIQNQFPNILNYNQLKLEYYKKLLPNEKNITLDNVHYLLQKKQIMNALERYKELGLKEYEVHCSLDESTCEVCGEFDGVPLPISKAVIGKNAPPFHNDCRCYITPAFDGLDSSRSIRNPVTGKSELVDYLTYKEYKQKYLNR